MNSVVLRIVWISVLISWLAPFVYAIESTDETKSKVLSTQEVVRLKLFPGGSDEEPLRVQKDLFVPRRMVNMFLLQKKTLEEVLSEQEDMAEVPVQMQSTGVDKKSQ